MIPCLITLSFWGNRLLNLIKRKLVLSIPLLLFHRHTHMVSDWSHTGFSAGSLVIFSILQEIDMTWNCMPVYAANSCTFTKLTSYSTQIWNINHSYSTQAWHMNCSSKTCLRKNRLGYKNLWNSDFRIKKVSVVLICCYTYRCWYSHTAQ